MIITINDIGSKKTYSFENAEDTSVFLKHTEASGVHFQKVVDIIAASERVPKYSYDNKHSQWSKDKGWVYVISAGGKVVKIGQTDATLSSRFSSYQAGTRANREKGTCSVTNWYCSEFFRECHNKGIAVSVYAYCVPLTTQQKVILGKTYTIRDKHAYAYESAVLSEYKEVAGSFPVLSNNDSEI